jgi:hypothetical protein
VGDLCRRLQIANRSGLVASNYIDMDMEEFADLMDELKFLCPDIEFQQSPTR